MKTRPPLAALLLAIACNSATAQALSPTFTYQGELKTAGSPANASFAMEFRLYNAGAGGTQLGSVQIANAVPVANGRSAHSQMKDQVHDYTAALDQINALRPVNYHYIAGGKAAFQPAGEHVGFIAQKLQQVFPEWVLQGEGYLQLSMRGFEAVAVRGMQELSAADAVQRARLGGTRGRNCRAACALGSDRSQIE